MKLPDFLVLSRVASSILIQYDGQNCVQLDFIGDAELKVWLLVDTIDLHLQVSILNRLLRPEWVPTIAIKVGL